MITTYFYKSLPVILVLAIALLLGGCGAQKIQNTQSYRSISPKAYIQLKQEIVVEPGHARAFFQLGELIKPSELNLYEVDCELEIRHVKEVKQTIKPGKFQVMDAQQDISPIVFVPETRTQVAWVNHIGPSDIKRFWRFKLSSQTQPNVMNLICRGVQDFPYKAQLPSYEEMQFALGEYVQLKLF